MDTTIVYQEFVIGLDKVIKKLKESGMSYEDAVEFWEYNQIGAYVGENTPCFIERIKK